MTFISRMDASVSTDMEVSQLPLREKPPPSEAKVAADRVDAVLDAWKRQTNLMQIKWKNKRNNTLECAAITAIPPEGRLFRQLTFSRKSDLSST